MPDFNPAVTRPLDEDGEPIPGDDPDTVAQTRPLPEPDPSEVPKARPDLLPTIGHIGRYALKYKIGAGGLGTVYAAHDPLLSRLIAIKTLNVDLPAENREQFNALFLNEAKAAGSLNNPHIVTMYDAGLSEQGTYIAMELLRGKDLRQLLTLGWKPTPAQAALIVRRVADALSYAHHKGVIHRDIKPANIFMVGRTSPRVLDFGIARIRQAESMGRDDEQSRFQEVFGGSPYYMAPEQVRQEPTDRRADVYSLGVVLYELLTTKRPFTGNSLDEIAYAVLKGEVLAPHEINPEVPKALSEIVAKAMERDVAVRTRSARALSQALRDWLSQQGDVPQSGVGSSSSSRASGSSKSGQKVSRSWMWSLAAAGWLTALGGLGWFVWQERSSAKPDETMAAVAPVAAKAVPAATPMAPVPVLSETAPTPAPAEPAAVAPAPVVMEATNVVATSISKPVAVPSGVVKLTISPWGEVFEGDRSLGVTPPMTQLKLPVGKHTLTIRNGDASPLRKTVDVKAGAPVSINHQF
ncbi:serine/threonine-protein kinase [Aquabacterium sp.]|uniref:serine/threonine-protein kinase n=1 Tax=Aquabacterium sp. TaxID=1872578 RepID=UPI002489DEA8|nr:serine/threonine-protein kinase [Aquabacterium sp.]MDI1259801.1 serine/threonine-protein kinase [Aquabacterium sp.]